MDPNTAIGLGVFALAAILLGWIVRTFVRALVRGVGTVKDIAAQQAAQMRAQEQLLGRGAVGGSRPIRPRAASPAPPAPRPRPVERQAAASKARPLHPHHAGLLVSPFRGGQSLLRSIIVSEALGPPLGLRRPEGR